MSTFRKILESLDVINAPSPYSEKEKAFKDLGLDEHQWDVFELVWNYCNRQPGQDNNES